MFPQCEEMVPSFATAVARARGQQPQPDFLPTVYTLQMHGRATPTDLVSAAPVPGNGLVLSSRVKAILDGFRLDRARFFEAQIHHRKETLQGYFLAVVDNDATPAIDFHGSKFFLSTFFDRIRDVQLSSQRDLTELGEHLPAGQFVRADALALRDGSTLPDVLTFPFVEAGVYVSQDVRDTIARSPASGIEFIEAKEIGRAVPGPR